MYVCRVHTAESPAMPQINTSIYAQAAHGQGLLQFKPPKKITLCMHTTYRCIRAATNPHTSAQHQVLTHNQSSGPHGNRAITCPPLSLYTCISVPTFTISSSRRGPTSCSRTRLWRPASALPARPGAVAGSTTRDNSASSPSDSCNWCDRQHRHASAAAEFVTNASAQTCQRIASAQIQSASTDMRQNRYASTARQHSASTGWMTGVVGTDTRLASTSSGHDSTRRVKGLLGYVAPTSQPKLLCNSRCPSQFP
jgi:hypothetical protein